MDNFVFEKTFFDITDSTINQKETRTYVTTNPAITPNTITSGSIAPAVVREITSIEILPPVDGSGNWEDLREVWLNVDGSSIQHYIDLSGVGESLMAPFRTQLVGGPSMLIPLGTPMWRVIEEGGANMPLRATGIKYNRRIELVVHSEGGVTGQWRVILRGWEYSPAMLAVLSRGWNPSVNMQTFRRQVEGKPALQFTFPASQITPDTWTSLPGGVNQGSIKVMPYVHFAYNAQTTQPQQPYALTNLTTVGGASGNVESTFQDLAFEFAQNDDAFILRGFGVRGVSAYDNGNPPTKHNTPGLNLARAGWWVNGDVLPQETGNAGVFITNGVNSLHFGNAQPVLPDRGQFFPIPRFPGRLLLYKDDAVPYIGAGTAGIPAYSVMLALNGVLVERG